MYAELKGKIALITGAGLSTGIGFGIAEQLAANGMDILLADLPGLGGRMDESCALLRKYGVRVEPLELDIADETSIRAAVEAVRTSRRPYAHWSTTRASIAGPAGSGITTPDCGSPCSTSI